MKTSADPVRDYLSAVEREGSALPADRRRELLADLAEHIEVTRAERPGVTVGEVLAELGDPRTIAATALAEAGSGGVGAPAPDGAGAAVRRGKVHPMVPLLMLTLPFLFASAFPSVPGSGFCSTLFRVIGAVLLCTSVHWTPARKATGVLLTAVLPTLAIAVWKWAVAVPVGDAPAHLANAATLVLLAGTTAWLWRVRRA
ncbi:HAAS signaling domain-containing protein [Streptomyces sp. NPDC099050]|uniref:HAAS signaling domain-containing protein n=1 Tax=Streptomyces sp. NPDC099050 TaxID=3366100 RepID=UPI0038260264